MDSHPKPEDIEQSERWAPPLPSRAAELLKHLPPRESDTWASRALRALLESVHGDDASFLLFPIAMIDAWTEGDEAFCVVYTPPRLGPDLVGVRRHRGDGAPDPWLLLNTGQPRYPTGYDPGVNLAMPDAPDDFGRLLLDDISDSLGVFGDHLRYDADGLGWWGSLEDHLPSRPS